VGAHGRGRGWGWQAAGVLCAMAHSPICSACYSAADGVCEDGVCADNGGPARWALWHVSQHGACAMARPVCSIHHHPCIKAALTKQAPLCLQTGRRRAADAAVPPSDAAVPPAAAPPAGAPQAGGADVPHGGPHLQLQQLCTDCGEHVHPVLPGGWHVWQPALGTCMRVCAVVPQLLLLVMRACKLRAAERPRTECDTATPACYGSACAGLAPHVADIQRCQQVVPASAPGWDAWLSWPAPPQLQGTTTATTTTTARATARSAEHQPAGGSQLCRAHMIHMPCALLHL
jgi:hypothetical protein